MKIQKNKRAEQRPTVPKTTVHHRRLRAARNKRVGSLVVWSVGWLGIAAGAVYLLHAWIGQLYLRPGQSAHIISRKVHSNALPFELCVVLGALITLPILVYNAQRIIAAVQGKSMRGTASTSWLSALLIAVAVTFAAAQALPFVVQTVHWSFASQKFGAAVLPYNTFITFYLFGWALIALLPVILFRASRLVACSMRGMLAADVLVVAAAAGMGWVIDRAQPEYSLLFLSLPAAIVYQATLIGLWGIDSSVFKRASISELLAADIAEQAERLRRLEDAVSMRITTLEPAPVLVTDEPEESMPEQEVPPALADGRTNFQYTLPSKRVRRRIML